jgi:serine/threonine-protein kinase
MSSTLEQGSIFAGRYRVLRRIATGGMGAIYEVLHLETERRRALKVMLPGVLHDEEIRKRFIREAKVGAHFDSDFIVDVVDAGIDEATEMPFLVMELLRGEDLGARLKRLGRLDPEGAVTYLYHAALALDGMHRAGVVHRDVKPENLFLMERDDGPPRIKVLDFGVAKVIAEGALADATLGMGTPLYMSPEQYDPHARITGAADLYALGMVAYALLVGSAYWAQEASSGRLYALAAVTMRGPREPASVRAAARGVQLPLGFDAWFSQVTALDPARRPASAGEAVRALADVFGLAPPSRPIPSSPFGWSGMVQDARDSFRSLPGYVPPVPPSRAHPSSPFGWWGPEPDAREGVRALVPDPPVTLPNPLPALASSLTAPSAPVPAGAAQPQAPAPTPRRSILGAVSLLGVGAVVLAWAAFSGGPVVAPSTRASASGPPGDPSAATAPPPAPASPASAAPASVAPTSTSSHAPPARSAKGRTPPAAPLYPRN